MNKRIGFVLPAPRTVIAGGYKIIYDYANYLAEKNYSIIILYDCRYIGARFNLKISLVKKLIGSYKLKNVKWASLHKSITSHIVLSAEDIDRQNLDLVFASAIRTTEIVQKCNTNTKKGYLIQGFENWSVPSPTVYESYKLHLYNIVVSQWLYNIVRQHSTEKLFLCPNGIDVKHFKIINPIVKRNRHSIAFLYHEDKVKGLEYLIPNITKWKEKYPDLQINSFGAFERTDILPNFVNYTKFASKEQLLNIYNNSAIFICSSIEEGFGLPGAESMACGCALVTTDTNGCREYADDSNSVIVPCKNTNAIYEAVMDLLENDTKRINLAQKGNEQIQLFSLDNSHAKMHYIIENILKD